MKPIDLTATLDAARARVAWSRARAQQLLADLAEALPRSRVDWDCQAGEDWGRIVLDREVAALVWFRVAFAFVDRKHAAALSEAIADAVIHVEVVEDWKEPKYSVDEEKLLQLSGRDRMPESFRADRFSANELWWATV